MINPGKVRAMTARSLFEQKKGRSVMYLKEYCEDFPVWKGLARSALSGLLLSLMILLVFFIAIPDLLDQLLQMVGAVWTGAILALFMAVFAALYSVVSDILFRRMYVRSRSSLCGYHAEEEKLKRIRHDEEHG